MASLDDLWARWDAAGRGRDRHYNDLVLLGRRFVRSVVKSMPMGSEHDIEEMVSAGVDGLLQAIERYDPSQGVMFRSFAQHQVKGRVRDAMRFSDVLPRRARRAVSKLLAAEEALAAKLHRVPTDQEVAGHLDVTERQVQAIRRDLAAASVASMVEIGSDGSDFDEHSDRQLGVRGVGAAAEVGDGRLDYEVLLARLSDALKIVEQPEQTVLVLYYIEQLGMPEIARELGVAPSMVSKMRDRAMAACMAHMRGA